MSRSQARNGYSPAIKISLLETDADEADADREAIRKEVARMRNTLVGFLIALTTASLLLALNLVVKAQ